MSSVFGGQPFLLILQILVTSSLSASPKLPLLRLSSSLLQSTEHSFISMLEIVLHVGDVKMKGATSGVSKFVDEVELRWPAVPAS